MDKITTCGFIIPNNKNFQQIKEELETLEKELKNFFFKKNTMHAVQFQETPEYYFSCCIKNGEVRFGIYNPQSRTLSRTGDVKLLQQIDKETRTLILKRLELAYKNKIHLPPLDQPWELSIEQEKLFTDNNNLTFLSDPYLLDVCAEPKEVKLVR